MCLAVPGKVLSIDQSDPELKMASVDFSGIIKDISVQWLPEVKVGDYVLTHVGMALNMSGLSGDWEGGNGFFTVNCVRNLASAPNRDAEATINMDANPADCYGRVNLDGTIMEPYVEQLGSDIDFELVALDVTVQYTKSRSLADSD